MKARHLISLNQGATGVEPVTYRTAADCSTTEPYARVDSCTKTVRIHYFHVTLVRRFMSIKDKHLVSLYQGGTAVEQVA